MGSVLNPLTSFQTDQGVLNLTPMKNWNPVGEQVDNIQYLGTNLLTPLLNQTPPASITYNILGEDGNPTGATISISTRISGDNVVADYSISPPPGYPGGEYGGGIIIVDDGTLECDAFYYAFYPNTSDMDSVEHWAIIKHLVTGPVSYLIIGSGNSNLNIFENADRPEADNVTTVGGGIPELDVVSTEIDFPALPSLDFLDTGMISVYTLTIGEALNLSSYLWNANAGGFWDTILKLYNDPMEALIGFYMLPVTPTSTPGTIKIGNANTSVSASRVTKQYYDIDLGNVSVGNYYATFYDWNPYTTCEIYLPFIGTRQLNIDEVMGSKLKLHYYVDILTGNFTAMLKIQRVNGNEHNENLNSIMYHWNGNMKSDCPLTAKDMTQLFRTAIQSIHGIMSSGSNSVGPAMAGGDPMSIAAGAVTGSVNAFTGGITNMLTTPQSIQHTGNISCVNGMLSVLKPYLILSRASVTVPQNIRHDAGLYANISTKIGDCNGFTKAAEVHIVGLKCTDVEKNEIEAILKAGIIV